MDTTFVLYMYAPTLRSTLYSWHFSCTCMNVYPAEWLYNRVHTSSHDYTTALTIYGYFLLYTWHLSCICMRVWPAEWLHSCVHTLPHDYATIYRSCICITHGAKVRHLRTIPIYVRGPVMINKHFDMIHIHDPIRGPGFGSHDMIPWSSQDLSRGESGLPIGQWLKCWPPIGQLLFAREMSRHDVSKEYKKDGRNAHTLLLT